MKRRNFIRNSFLTASSIGLYTWQIEPFWVEIVKVKMPIKNLPQNLVGKTLMQISDIHISPRFNYQFIIDSFKEAQNLAPDFVVYTGDYVTKYRPETGNTLNLVLQNAVKGKLGTVAILGNHDYGKNWSEPEVANAIVHILQKNDIKVLRNEQITFGGLTFIGLDDFWGTNFNPAIIMKSYDKSKPHVLLCHNPDVCDLDIWDGYEGWILAGHTHGGQCKPPFLLPPMLPVQNKRYTAGQIDIGNNQTLYINRALGHLWQVRFNVRPEITLFELCR